MPHNFINVLNLKSMNKMYFFMFFCVLFFASCSGDSLSEEDVIGGWQLEKIRVEGADCAAVFGAGVPDEYLANDSSCAKPTEVLGNASRCINFDIRANGEGTFLWSEINGGTDFPLTYTIENGEFIYCLDLTCSGAFKLIDGKLENRVELRLDDDCSAVFVLVRK